MNTHPYSIPFFRNTNRMSCFFGTRNKKNHRCIAVSIILFVLFWSIPLPIYAEDGTTPAEKQHLLRESVDTGFRPGRDGYQFANWHNVPYTELTYGDLQHMFGDDAVLTMHEQGCSINPAAQVWLDNANRVVQNGRCDGFTTTSLRFFKGLDDPADFQKGAKTTYELDFEQSQNHISYYWALQLSNPVASSQYAALRHTPAEVLETLYESMSHSMHDPHTLILYNQSRTAGHSVTPYAIEVVEPELYHVKVYDSYYPNDTTRYVEINTFTNRWMYALGKDTTWHGNATSASLGAVPLSLYDQQPTCAWCRTEETLQEVSASVQTMLTGPGRLLIHDDQNRRMGYVEGTFVNEMPEGFRTLPPAGADVVATPVYYFAPTSTSTMMLNRAEADVHAEKSALLQSAPGYTVSIEELVLAAGEMDVVQMRMSDEVSEIRYDAAQQQEVTIRIVLNGDERNTLFELRGVDIGSEQPLRVHVDTRKQTLRVAGDEGNDGMYDVMMQRNDASGGRTFVHAAIAGFGSESRTFGYGDALVDSGEMTVMVESCEQAVCSSETMLLENQVHTAGLAGTVDAEMCTLTRYDRKHTLYKDTTEDEQEQDQEQEQYRVYMPLLRG